MWADKLVKELEKHMDEIPLTEFNPSDTILCMGEKAGYLLAVRRMVKVSERRRACEMRKGLLIHVGDDLNPSVFSTDKSYLLHLLPDHPDPDLELFTYGDWTHKTRAFGDLKAGDLVFFNFKFNDGNWYIAAFFHLKEVLDGHKVLTVRDLSPYKFNAHVVRGDLGNSTAKADFRMLVGNQRNSDGHIRVPIRIDETFWKKLDLRDKYDVPFIKRLKERKHEFGKYSAMQINGSFLRMPKPLNEFQVDASLIQILIANRPNLRPPPTRYVKSSKKSSIRKELLSR